VHARHGLRWWLLSIVLFPIAVPAQDTIRFTPTVGSQAFKVREPVLRLKPRQVLVEESFPGLWPGDFGGNMDAPEIREGATVYLPIFHEGAYFYFGDGHALQGHGEIAGTGLEATMDVILQLDLIKNKPIEVFAVTQTARLG
jgi:acetamidase/formamidase